MSDQPFNLPPGQGADAGEVPVASIPQTLPPARRTPWEWIVDYNPFYLLSACCMLFGVFAMNDSLDWSPLPQNNLLVLIATLNVYELALVVLAVEWGSGRRRGWLSNLWLGARGDDGFVMVGKTFKGLTDELLTWQTEALLERLQPRSLVLVPLFLALLLLVNLHLWWRVDAGLRRCGSGWRIRLWPLLWAGAMAGLLLLLVCSRFADISVRETFPRPFLIALYLWHMIILPVWLLALPFSALISVVRWVNRKRMMSG